VTPTPEALSALLARRERVRAEVATACGWALADAIRDLDAIDAEVDRVRRALGAAG
jgi:hypothetical protein